MPVKFLISADFQGYAASVGSDVVMQELEGGPGRYRQDCLRATSVVNARWTVTRDEFVYARAFYNADTNHGADAFLIDLTIDNSSVEEVVAHFVPGSFHWEFDSGVFVITAQLEVERNPEDSAFDEALVALAGGFGVDETLILTGLASLERLVNVDLPQTAYP